MFNRDRLCLSFEIPLLPPSVNHYVTHTQRGGKTIHRKTPEAEAFENSFLAMLPADVRGEFVAADRFHVGLLIYPGPGDKGDIDNYPKLILDCIAKAGMLRSKKTEKNPYPLAVSDSWIKKLSIRIMDEEREKGPKVFVAIEALP